jgi:hypothetical protein
MFYPYTEPPAMPKLSASAGTTPNLRYAKIG